MDGRRAGTVAANRLEETMGWSYRKSIKMGPFRLNLSRSGVGHSVGGRGARYTRTADGRKEMTFRIPGTGLSWRRPMGPRRRRRR